MKELIIVFLIFICALYGFYSLLKTAVFKIYMFIIKLRKESDVYVNQCSSSSSDSNHEHDASGSS